MITATLLSAALVLLSATQSEAKLGLGAQPEFKTDGEIRVPVMISTPREDGVAALQFDLTYEAARLQFKAAEVGSAASAAEKITQANTLSPGAARIIVAGLNRNTIGDGIVVWAVFTPVPGARPPFSLNITGSILSDPYGNPLAVQTSPDALTLDPSAKVALAADSGTAPASHSGMDMLIRYRALVFASIMVGGTMFLARRAPRKGRIR